MHEKQTCTPEKMVTVSYYMRWQEKRHFFTVPYTNLQSEKISKLNLRYGNDHM